jgi:hypothetical protein
MIDAVKLPNGTATVTAQAGSAQASEKVTVAETLPTVTINKINGNDVINNQSCGGGDDDDGHDGGDESDWQGGQGGRSDRGSWGQDDHEDDDDDEHHQSASPLQLSGSVTRVAANSTFQVKVSDGGFSKSYTATVNAAGTAWTATVPATDVVQLPNGTATFSAQVTDQFGNTSLPAVQQVAVEGTTPLVLAVAASPSAGDLDAGKNVTITLTLNEPVKVTGTPTLSLDDCGTAAYDSAHSTATSLVFDYTVATGQNTSDLTITGVNLPRGTSIQDLAGDNADLSGARVKLGLEIDTTPPTVCAVTASPGSGEVTTGHTIVLTLAMSEPVTLAGTPSLVLNDGAVASYDQAHSTPTSLVFDYAVASGQMTSDLKVAGIELPSSVAIQDGAGNNADLSGAAADLHLGINQRPSGSSSPGIGNFTIPGTSNLELFGASSASVAFASGAAGTLALDSSQLFTGQVSGFSGQDAIDLGDIGFGSHTTLAYQANSHNTGGTLTVRNGFDVARIALVGQYMASSFAVASDGQGGTLVTDPPPSAQNGTLGLPHHS